MIQLFNILVASDKALNSIHANLTVYVICFGVDKLCGVGKAQDA